jgi:hypothetical protein
MLLKVLRDTLQNAAPIFDIELEKGNNPRGREFAHQIKRQHKLRKM